MELILVDDRSTDGSSEWLRDYADAKGALFLQPDRRLACPVKTWSLGVTSARGKWIWLAEADDLAAPDFLKTLFHIADAGGNYDFVYCASVKVDAGGMIFGDYPNPPGVGGNKPLSRSSYLNPGPDLLRTFLQGNPVPNVSACLFRAHALRPVLETPEDLFLSGDWWVYCQIALKSGLCYVPQVLNGHRCHFNSVRAGADRSWVRVKERYRVLQLIQKRFHPSDKDWEDALHSAFKDFAFARSSKIPHGDATPIEDFSAIEGTDPRFLTRLVNWRTAPKWCALCTRLRVPNGHRGNGSPWAKGVYHFRAYKVKTGHSFASIAPRGSPGFWFVMNRIRYCDLDRNDSGARVIHSESLHGTLISESVLTDTLKPAITQLEVFERFRLDVIGTRLGRWLHGQCTRVLNSRIGYQVQSFAGGRHRRRHTDPYILFGVRAGHQ